MCLVFRMLKDKCYDILANIRNSHVVRNDENDHLSVRIFVLSHFDCCLPDVFSDRRIYIPLRCGGGKDVGAEVLKDDLGVNISDYNLYLNEMTGIYWVAKHLCDFDGVEYIGFNHYRRSLEWSPRLLSRNSFVATSVFFHRRIKERMCFMFDQSERQYLLEKVVGIMSANESADFHQYLNSHTMYAYNMFVMSRTTFERYFSFIERFIDLMTQMVDSNELSIRNRSPQGKRIFGYMLEHLTSFWIFRERRLKSSCVWTVHVQNFNVERSNV